jgi:hypothetical protein
MIGARQVAGSTISNGGDSSPSNWVIVGRRPLSPLVLDGSLLPENRRFYERTLSVITTILPSEKSRNGPGRVLENAKRPYSLP